MSTGLLFRQGKDVKSLAFAILSREYPLKLIELTNLINKRHGLGVTFQAVRKAALSLEEEGVLLRKDRAFSLNPEWVKEAKGTMDILYTEIIEHKARTAKSEGAGGQIFVYHFATLNEMMKYWEDIIDSWHHSFRKGDYNINAYQCAHPWEGLLHLDKEHKIMSQLIKKGVRSVALCTGNTPLDKKIVAFYREIGVDFVIDPSRSSFDRGYYVGTYGDLIVSAQYPERIVRDLDRFFKTSADMETLDFGELSRIANQKIPVKMTVIKNLEMAKQVNASILSLMGRR